MRAVWLLTLGSGVVFGQDGNRSDENRQPAARVEAGQNDRSSELAAEAVRAYRRLFEQLPSQGRLDLLVELLGSGHPELVRLASDLSIRLLLNAEPLSDKVRAAAMSRLDDPQAAVRLAVVDLLTNLSPESTADAARSALEREREPAIRAKLLSLLRGAPAHPQTIELALRFADQPAPVGQAAAAVLDARPGIVRSLSETEQQNLAAALALFDDAELSPGQARLLVTLGRQDRAIKLLDTAEPAVARAAAEALGAAAEYLRPMIITAKQRPELADIVVAALATHRQTPESFEMALSLEPAEQYAERNTRQLAQFAVVLPQRRLANLLGAIDDPARRLAIASLITDPIVTPPAEETVEHEVSLDTALARTLAHASLETGNPAAAERLIAAAGGERPPSELALLDLRAKLRLGKIDDATRIVGLQTESPAPADEESDPNADDPSRREKSLIAAWREEASNRALSEELRAKIAAGLEALTSSDDPPQGTP